MTATHLQRAPLPRRAATARAAAVILAACFALAFPLESFAQQETTDEEVVRVETNLVAVPVYVTDRRGRRVRDLTREDFRVTVESAPVQITHFASGAERVALVFLLDASGSVRELTARQRETALSLLSHFGESSRVAVLRFWERPELTVPFTRQRERVREAFLLPALPNRRTAIFDAAVATARAFRAAKGDPAERRIVILISDGVDTASTVRAEAAVNEARAAGISFYVVHLPLYSPRGGQLVRRPFSKGFRELAKETGGQFFTVGDPSASLDPRATLDLAPVFQAIAEDLQSQYVLGFNAPSSDTHDRGRPRRLAVQLNADPRTRGLRVRALRETYQLN